MESRIHEAKGLQAEGTGWEGSCSERTSWESWPLNEGVTLGLVERRGRYPGSGTRRKVMAMRRAEHGKGVMPLASLSGGRRWMVHEGGDLCLLCLLLNTQDPGT